MQLITNTTVYTNFITRVHKSLPIKNKHKAANNGKQSQQTYWDAMI